jgi:hypothetical protein
VAEGEDDEEESVMQHTKSSAENSGTATEQYKRFTAEERAAMKEHAQEQKKAAARRGSRAEKEVAAERDVLAKIAEIPEADRFLAERIHTIVKAAAPDLTPTTAEQLRDHDIQLELLTGHLQGVSDPSG